VREIKRPIFIVGSPRSGTNVFYYKFAQHPALAWVSNITKKLPDSIMLTRLLMMFRNDHRPTEAKNIWGRYSRGDDDFLAAEHATPSAKKFMRKVVSNHLKLFNKPRFVNKYPRNSVRIEFLNAIFPDACFIHVIRDGRAVAHSILRAREKHENQFWGVRPPGWRELLGIPIIEACAMQWKLAVECALDSAAKIEPERYTEIRYEEFCREPIQTLRHAGERCGLEWSEQQLAELASDIENRNAPAQFMVVRYEDVDGMILSTLGQTFRSRPTSSDLTRLSALS